MTEISELATPFNFHIPSEQVVRLEGLVEMSTLATGDDAFIAERAVMDGIVSVSHNILQKQGPELKKPVYITDSEYVLEPPNCTDVSAAQLHVCASIGIMALARFNGNHASVVVPSTNRGFWSLGGTSSFTRLGDKTRVLDDSTAALAQAVTGVSEHTGALIWHSLGDDSIRRAHFAYFDGDDIRAETSKLREGHGSAGGRQVIVSTPIALNMLRAIDVLDTFRSNQKSPKSTTGYNAAKFALRHLVPKLR